MVAQSWDKPQDWYQTNVVAQVKLHELLRKFDLIQKMAELQINAVDRVPLPTAQA